MPLEDDIRGASEWLSKALHADGYVADFSIESLRDIDRFVDDNTLDGRPTPTGRLSEETGPRMFAIGAYVGEVIRRHLGAGEWSEGADSSDLNVELQFPSSGVIWPMQRALKRVQFGPEESLADYARIIVERETPTG